MKKFWHILGMLCLMLALAAGAAAATYEPIEVELPIQIQVAGHEYEGEKYFIPLRTLFELELSASADTPKPEGAKLSADGKTWSLTQKSWPVINGEEFSEKLGFGAIVFDKAGQYTYTLKQNADSSKEYVKYDTGEHEIKLNVRAKKGKLNCTVSYDGKAIGASDACIIRNAYQAGELVISCDAKDAPDGKTFPVTARLPALEGYMGRIAYAVKRKNGETESVTPAADSVTAQLAHGETLTLMGVPTDIAYQVTGRGTTEYLVSYDTAKSGRIASGQESKTTVYFNKDALSVALEAKIFLYATVYQETGTTRRYDYPGKSLPMTLTLRAKDSDAPLPLGVSEVYERTASFAANSEHGKDYVRMGTFKLDSIIFKPEDLKQADERTFIYYIAHGKDNQKTSFDYLKYNLDTDKPNEKQVEVAVTVKKNESGKLSASVQYAEDSYKFPDSRTDTTAKARFADQYLSTSVDIEHENTGLGSIPEDTAEISLQLLDEKDQPMKDWSFYTSAKESESGEEEKAAKKPDSKGKLSFNLSDKGSAVVYGIPDGTTYRIEKTDGGSYVPQYEVIRVVNETTEEAAVNGVIAADGAANGKIICRIVDTFRFNPAAFSAITLPAQTTTIMKGALSGTAAEVYVLPEKIETIEEGAFEDLPNARFIVIPENAQTPDRSLFPADVLLIRPDGTPVE